MARTSRNSSGDTESGHPLKVDATLPRLISSLFLLDWMKGMGSASEQLSLTQILNL